MVRRPEWMLRKAGKLLDKACAFKKIWKRVCIATCCETCTVLLCCSKSGFSHYRRARKPGCFMSDIYVFRNSVWKDSSGEDFKKFCFQWIFHSRLKGKTSQRGMDFKFLLDIIFQCNLQTRQTLTLSAQYRSPIPCPFQYTSLMVARRNAPNSPDFTPRCSQLKKKLLPPQACSI